MHLFDHGFAAIRPYATSDYEEWRRMRGALWPDEGGSAHEAQAWLARKDATVIVAQRKAAPGLCGFAEVGERSIADGCESTPVAYLEGWYVDADVRRQGIGAALIRVVEAWARERGYRELGSDAVLDNTISHRAHRRLGFEEVGRVVNFRKPL